VSTFIAKATFPPMVTNGCYTCSQNNRIGELPPRKHVILE
jgi:hypothetical protein